MVRYISSCTTPYSSLSSTQTSSVSLQALSHGSDTRPSSLCVSGISHGDITSHHIKEIVEGHSTVGDQQQDIPSQLHLFEGVPNVEVAGPLPLPVQYLQPMFDNHLLTNIPVLPPEQYMDPKTPDDPSNSNEEGSSDRVESVV